MGVTTTPINGFTLPDDNELLRNVYVHLRNHAAQLEAALRSRGLTSQDVTGYLDLLGRVSALEASTLLTPTYQTGFQDYIATGWQSLRFRKAGTEAWGLGVFAAVASTGQVTMAAGNTYPVATLPTGGWRPLANESGLVPIWNGSAWSTAVCTVLTTGVLQIVPQTACSAGWNCHIRSLRWRVS